MTALWVTLLIPFAGMLLLAVIGERRGAGRLNVVFNTGMLAASLALAWQVLEDGPLLSQNRCSISMRSTSTWWRSRPSSA